MSAWSLAVPELDDLIRFVVIAAFFLLPMARAALEKARAAAAKRTGPTRGGRSSAEPAADLETRSTETASSERTILEELNAPPPPPPSATSAPVSRRVVRRGLAEEAAAEEAARRLAPVATPASGLPREAIAELEVAPFPDAAFAPVPGEDELEALGPDVGAVERLLLPRAEPAASVAPRRSRFAPNGWRTAVLLREVLGPPRALEDHLPTADRLSS